jgi:formiminotetrahydrofolate cyclodeaminase
VAIRDWTIVDLLEVIRQPKPAWGGGSAGAAAGAIAFALIEKITLIAKIDANELTGLLNNLLQLAEEDTLAYQSMIRPIDNSLRSQNIKNSLAISEKIAEICLSGIQTSGDLMASVKPGLRADLFVAAHLCYTGCFSAAVNLKTNAERLYPQSEWLDTCRHLEHRLDAAAGDIRRWMTQYPVSDIC